MFEKEMDELRSKYWLERYEGLGKEISRLVSLRSETDAVQSLNLLLSGFGGSARAVNILKATNA
jgi:hypothetical protein